MKITLENQSKKKRKKQVSVRCTPLMQYAIEEIGKRIYKESGNKGLSGYTEATYMVQVIMYLIDNNISLHDVCKDTENLIDFLNDEEDCLIRESAPAAMRLPGEYFLRYLDMLEATLDYLYEIYQSGQKEMKHMNEEYYQQQKSAYMMLRKNTVLTQNVNPNVVDHIKHPDIVTIVDQLNRTNIQLAQVQKENTQYEEQQKQLKAENERLKEELNQCKEEVQQLNENSSKINSQEVNLPLEKVNEILKLTLQEHEEKLKQTVQEHGKAQREEYALIIKSLQTEKEEYALTIKSLQDENKRLSNKIEELRNEEQHSHTLLLEEQLDKLQSLTELISSCTDKTKGEILQAINKVDHDNLEMLQKQNDNLTALENKVESMPEHLNLLFNHYKDYFNVPLDTLIKEISENSKEQKDALSNLDKNLKPITQLLTSYVQDKNYYTQLLRLLGLKHFLQPEKLVLSINKYIAKETSQNKSNTTSTNTISTENRTKVNGFDE